MVLPPSTKLLDYLFNFILIWFHKPHTQTCKYASSRPHVDRGRVKFGSKQHVRRPIPQCHHLKTNQNKIYYHNQTNLKINVGHNDGSLRWVLHLVCFTKKLLWQHCYENWMAYLNFPLLSTTTCWHFKKLLLCHTLIFPRTYENESSTGHRRSKKKKKDKKKKIKCNYRKIPLFRANVWADCKWLCFSLKSAKVHLSNCCANY